MKTPAMFAMHIDRKSNRRRDIVIGTLAVTTALLILLTGCAVSWIDKVSQSRVASAKIGYRTVSEFNGYYQDKTNKLKGTTADLEAARSLVYDTSTNLSLSLLTLESVENAYRLAPTNQLPVVNALNAVTANVSNIINTVNYIKQ